MSQIHTRMYMEMLVRTVGAQQRNDAVWAEKRVSKFSNIEIENREKHPGQRKSKRELNFALI